MALTDHVAILLGNSLDVARLNKKKTRSDFYAQFAISPAAITEVAAMVAEVYPGIPLSSIEINCATNAAQSKPFVGVPHDWYIIRMASQFAPELYAADGVTRIENSAARATFFAGMKVRVASGAWAWKNEFGKAGVSFNLFGVMDAGQGGERLAIGTTGASQAFKAHGAAPTPVAPATTAANAFGGQTQVSNTAPTGGANPFAQATPAAVANANPFAVQAAA